MKESFFKVGDVVEIALGDGSIYRLGPITKELPYSYYSVGLSCNPTPEYLGEVKGPTIFSEKSLKSLDPCPTRSLTSFTSGCTPPKSWVERIPYNLDLVPLKEREDAIRMLQRSIKRVKFPPAILDLEAFSNTETVQWSLDWYKKSVENSDPLPEKKPHVAGLDPEVIDPDAYRAFMRDL